MCSLGAKIVWPIAARWAWMSTACSSGMTINGGHCSPGGWMAGSSIRAAFRSRVSTISGKPTVFPVENRNKAFERK